ncbi:hypothetical protein ScalyP_jg4191 [Parmales sp. scaly parma]|nr:hypothetical protein ScalyP_jg4191 [Parmales sp. scaly parma]
MAFDEETQTIEISDSSFLTSFRVALSPYLPPLVNKLQQQIDSTFPALNEAFYTILLTLLSMFLLKVLFTSIIPLLEALFSPNTQRASIKKKNKLDEIGLGKNPATKSGAQVGSSSSSASSGCLVLGPLGSGKTSLVHRLRNLNSPSSPSITTVTSMKASEFFVTLDSDSNSTIRIVDYPGHPRLSAAIPAVLSTFHPNGSVLLLLDSTKPEHFQLASESLYDIMSEVLKLTNYNREKTKEFKVFVGVNKADSGILSKSKARVRNAMGKELERLRRTDAVLLQGTDTSNSDEGGSKTDSGKKTVVIALKKNNSVVDMDDLPVRVEFGSISGRVGEGADWGNLLAFIESCDK